MTPDERWRERERVRQKARKLKAKKPEPKPPEPREFPKFKDATVKLTTLKFSSFVDSDEKRDRVVAALSKLSISILELKPLTTWFRSISAVCHIKPLPSTLTGLSRRIDGTIELRANHSPAATIEELVRGARRHMIELCTHEIDEWLFVAGLGPNPHDWADGAVPAEAVGRIDPLRFPE